MLRQSAFAFAVFLSISSAAASARAQDAIDLHTVVIHDSPADVADWPATVRLERITMRPSGAVPNGLEFSTSGIPASWDYHVPGWGIGTGCPADGCILYTVWAVARVGEQLHAAAFIQMWAGRPATGAPILSDFHANWAYARDRWGELTDYAPQPGDLMGFFLSAGNARDTKTVTSRRERSNVVLVRLPANDAGVFEFTAAAAPPIATPPETPPIVPTPAAPAPAPPVLASLDYSPILNAIAARLGTIESRVTSLEMRVADKQDVAAIREDVRSFRAAANDVLKVVGKYVAPAIAGVIGGWKLK